MLRTDVRFNTFRRLLRGSVITGRLTQPSSQAVHLHRGVGYISVKGKNVKLSMCLTN
jgi:hypothetical protein